jgi:hypothetical protein
MSFETVIGSFESMTGQVSENGSPLVLELTDTLTLIYRTPSGIDKSKVLTIADASTGSWVAEWVEGDLPETGGYKGKVKVERPADSTYPHYHPDDGTRIIWWVYPTI